VRGAWSLRRKSIKKGGQCYCTHHDCLVEKHTELLQPAAPESSCTRAKGHHRACQARRLRQKESTSDYSSWPPAKGRTQPGTKAQEPSDSPLRSPSDGAAVSRPTLRVQVRRRYSARVPSLLLACLGLGCSPWSWSCTHSSCEQTQTCSCPVGPACGRQPVGKGEGKLSIRLRLLCRRL